MRVRPRVRHVSTDTDVALVDKRPAVFLKVDRFDLICRILDHTTDAAIARFIGMTEPTIPRARKGIIGEKFIAAVLKNFGERSDELAKYGIGTRFEDLFEIRDEPVTPTDKAGEKAAS